jgi:hypothetical protein
LLGGATLTLDLNNSLLSYSSGAPSSNFTNILWNSTIDNCNNIIYTVSNKDVVVVVPKTTINTQLVQRNRQRSQIQKRNRLLRNRLFKR